MAVHSHLIDEVVNGYCPGERLISTVDGAMGHGGGSGDGFLQADDSGIPLYYIT
jgi:hypothetical protein